MRIRLYGTRGSIPVCRPGTRRYGGNTTCLRVLSMCLPSDMALLIDAGSGLVEASRDLVTEGIRQVILLMTHYHHDHTMGLPVAGFLHDPSVETDILGPREAGIGPREVLETLMRSPLFPVPFSRLEGHTRTHGLDAMEQQILLIHPRAGIAWQDVAPLLQGPSDPWVGIGGQRVLLSECLRVRMTRTSHPEYTVSYRLEEGPTGRVAALLTDHEASAEIPEALRAHLQGVHLLLQDAQYSRRQWQERHVGHGHGTGAFAALVFQATGAHRLGLTHHDPLADDEQVDAIREETRQTLADLGWDSVGDRVFSAQDHQEEEV